MNVLLEAKVSNTKPRPLKRRRMGTDIADLLAIWQYVEYSAMRVLTGWGREAGHWNDKLAMCHHAWLQAESTDKLRSRLEMFPGNPDTPISGRFETALNVLFLAPTWADAMGALHEILYPTLSAAYEHYIATSHPVHDAPTHKILRELMDAKAPQVAWFQEFKAREDFELNLEYASRVHAALGDVEHFRVPIPATEPFAAPVGKNTNFRMKNAPGKVPDGDKAPNIIPFLENDWSTSVEARRLYFMIGYFWEMGVAEMQLRWLYYADFMPWGFIRDEARHMWDESRHGHSGLTRLRNFGLDIEDVGYNSYGAANAEGELPPMTPKDVYEAFYNVTQIAETGYFKTKGYCFEDFRDGGDEASAEMMQFDIIDETSHTEYGRQWLEVMMERAGVSEDYKARAVKDRQEAFRKAGDKVAAYRRFLTTGELPRTPEATQKSTGENGSSVIPGDSASLAKFCQQLQDEHARAHYERLLQILRDQCPLSNATTAPLRPHLPM
ncbi:hypothetical protein IAD21_00157 [Abditibacteriota bacterium]|nr:hypothetical protein IAD21_00157 [Abditibacteriota bacterium]